MVLPKAPDFDQQHIIFKIMYYVVNIILTLFVLLMLFGLLQGIYYWLAGWPTENCNEIYKCPLNTLPCETYQKRCTLYGCGQCISYNDECYSQTPAQYCFRNDWYLFLQISILTWVTLLICSAPRK